MRKKISVILAMILGIVMLCSFVACNAQRNVTEPPNSLTPSGPSDDTPTDADCYLRFTMPKHANSVFKKIYIDEFDITDVEYSIVYMDDDGAVLSEVPMGQLTLDMVAEEDRPLLTTVGDHIINVTAKDKEDNSIEGSFTLRLKDRNVSVSVINAKFRLEQGTAAYFGSRQQISGVDYATVDVDEGMTFASWEEFSTAFLLTRAGFSYAGVSFTSGGQSKSLLEDGTGFPFTISDKAGYTFTPVWNANVITVHFDLNLGNKHAALPPDTAMPTAPANQSVTRNSGAIRRPDTNEFNIFTNLYFSGWYTAKYDEGSSSPQLEADGSVVLDRMWNFNQTVSNSDIYLYAKWVEHDYSYTIYPMGGNFSGNIQPAKDAGGDAITLENAASKGYTVVNCVTRFDLASGQLNRIIFDGLKYGMQFDKYVAEVQVTSSGDKKVLKVIDLLKADTLNSYLVKGGEYLTVSGVFEDFQCLKPLSGGNASVLQDAALYVGWKLNLADMTDKELENDDETTVKDFSDNDLKKVSAYFTELLFKDSITLKADGTLRLEKACDDAVNKLFLPAEMYYNGVKTPISEIADRAFINKKALTYVDLSRAIYLTRIGAQAFAYSGSLEEIKQPQDAKSSLEVIGDNAFANTAYEARYTQYTDGLQFIILNDIIYKYCGDPATAEIDLTKDPFYQVEDFEHWTTGEAHGRVLDETLVESFNKRLKGATKIMSNALTNATSLKTLRLHANIEDIEANAFKGLDDFENLVIPAGSKLDNISEFAFNGCEKFLSSEGKNYNAEVNAIMIGNVYYRYLGKDATSVRIPAKNGDFPIKYIAASAMLGCDKVAEVVCESTDIEFVGADAFLNTQYLQNASDRPFVCINGIMTEFYGPGVINAAVMPDSVEAIADSAFNTFASVLSTVIIGKNVKSIGKYAFEGAHQLRSVSLTSITVNTDDDKKLDNAPRIDNTTFATATGEFMEDLRFYMQAGALEKLQALAKTPTAVTDPATRDWVDFYNLHSDCFEAEVLESVTLRPGRINGTLIDAVKQNNDWVTSALNAFKYKYVDGDKADLKGNLENALAIVNNSGASVIYDDLDPQFVKFEQITSDGKYKNLYVDEGSAVSRFVMHYTYNGDGKVFPSEPDDEDLVVIRVVRAPKISLNVCETYPELAAGNRYEYGNYISGMNLSIKGLEGNDKTNNNPRRPVYFTSYDKDDMKITVSWSDGGFSSTITLDQSALDDFEVSNGIQATATLTVDFYGIGQYVFNYTYSARKAKYNQVIQRQAVSLPLNDTGWNSLGAFSLYVMGEDGKYTQFAINSTHFSLAAGQEITTTELGQHTATLNFRDENALGVPTVDLVYTVVLEADVSQFEFETNNNASGDYAGRATVIRYRGTDAITVIVPEEYVTRDGKKYQVVAIGGISNSTGNFNSVFGDCKQLKTVYLPSTISLIGVGAFAGCTSLEHVYTATKSSTDGAQLKASNFDTVGAATVVRRGGEDIALQRVTVNNLDGISYETVGTDEEGNATTYGLAILGEYDLGTKDSRQRRIVYSVVGLSENFKLPQWDKSIPLYVYLPDTIYTSVALKDFEGNAVGNEVNLFYYANDGVRYAVENHLSNSLAHIGAQAFIDCVSLDFDEESFAHSPGLSFIQVKAFENSGVTLLDFTNNTKLTEVSNEAFKNCSFLREVRLPDVVTDREKNIVFADDLFSGCKLLEKMDFDGVGTIGERAFNGCSTLTEVTLTEDVETVGANAFGSCPALVIRCTFANATALPVGWDTNWNSGNCPVVYDCNNNDVAENGVTYFVNTEGESELRYMLEEIDDKKVATVILQKYGIDENVIVPGTVTFKGQTYYVTTIASGAFSGNERLKTIKVSSYLTTIESKAFENCVSLEEFGFSDGENGLTGVDLESFNGCAKLANAPGVPSSFTKDFFTYEINRVDSTVKITAYSNTEIEGQALTIGETVEYAHITYKITGIGAEAFNKATMASVKIGSNVTSIERKAFAECANLTAVTGCEGLETIGELAFADCALLSSFVTCPKIVTVDESAFDGCDALSSHPVSKS